MLKVGKALLCSNPKVGDPLRPTVNRRLDLNFQSSSILSVG